MEENEKLNNALSDPEAFQNDINDLEDRVLFLIK